ncbi:M48 family metallopeptidase [Roseovarius aestuarii]|uniref:Peptidase family M48 n=1 Tax=Roseovarius aestuarii TaxID=475083 RepID=A0A1X7BLI2_9RHOB|nr:M48 family metallopeptidase [Roseovarius aestuarii]SMC10491.1 Peptidase family M48 [Roseovarius aestuarii]
MRWIALACIFALTGCVATTQAPSPSKPAPTRTAAKKQTVPTTAQMQSFSRVVRTMEPVAERECRRRAKGLNCDFKIVVDDRPGQPANAFQTLDRSGRPILAFNLAFIAQARNRHELAFVMGHESAHHISGHIARQRQNATAGAILLGGIAAITGAGSGTISSAQDIGAAVGARTYSKDFELEADALGTIITKRAGYNPVKGAQFFTQIPDPGDRFLGTHPPNAKRMETVIRVNNSL